jgi:hypothetical protein
MPPIFFLFFSPGITGKRIEKSKLEQVIMWQSPQPQALPYKEDPNPDGFVYIEKETKSCWVGPHFDIPPII